MMKRNILKKWIADKGLLQREVAELFGITESFLNNLINGNHRNISFERFNRIKKVTKISYEKLRKYFLAGR